MSYIRDEVYRIFTAGEWLGFWLNSYAGGKNKNVVNRLKRKYAR